MIKRDGYYEYKPETLRGKIDASYYEGVSKDTVVYRIFTAERFFQLLDSRQITFVRPDLWDDPFENIFLNTFVQRDDGSRILFYNLVENIYSQCWTTCEESDALWRIYSPEQTGVMVKSTAGKIVESFYGNIGIDEHFDVKKGFDSFIKAGKVKYVDESQIIDMVRRKFSKITSLSTGKSIDETLLHKRKPFIHEQELRFIVKKKGVDSKVYSFGIDINFAFDEVVFDPRMHETNIETFTRGLRARGYSNIIRQSGLYYRPRIVIPDSEFNSFFNGKEGQTFTHQELFGE